MSRDALKTDNSPPKVPAWFQGGFHAFLGPYLRRHFHSVSVSKLSWKVETIDPNEPLIVYANHPSWWDPLIAHFVNCNLLKPRQLYAPIDAQALEQYKVFSKLGFFGVSLSSHSGAAAFLKQSAVIVESPSTALWMTPEGRFCDSRDLDAPLMPGLAHLCTKLKRGVVLPMAIEYTFWEERLPECLIQFGDPVKTESESPRSKETWNELLLDRLRSAQKSLAKQSISRNADQFSPILRGAAGAGGSYDLMRRMKSLLKRESFRPEHGDKLQ